MEHKHVGKYKSRTPKGRTVYKRRPVHKHKKIELYVGGDKDTWKVNKDYINRFNNIMKNYYPGYTYNKVTGRWKERDIDTIKTTILTTDEKKINPLVNDLKKHFEQESILVTKQDSEVKFQ